MQPKTDSGLLRLHNAWPVAWSREAPHHANLSYCNLQRGILSSLNLQ